MPLKWTSLPADITLLIWDFVAQPPFAPVPWYRAEHLASRVPEYDTDTLARLRILQLVSLEWARAARARIYRKLHINPKVASAMPLLQCIATPRGSALDIGVHVRMLGVGCENNHSDHGEALWSAVCRSTRSRDCVTNTTAGRERHPLSPTVARIARRRHRP
jgi:hypothetical protein